jgi:deazaflavin-dependent oxidoreductase (nitroreductase family)
VSLRGALADAGFKTMNAAHRCILRLSGNRLLTAPMGMAGVELSVMGRRSGRWRVTLLTAPILDDRRVVLVASKGGDDRDPEWFRNLVVHPDIELTVVRTGEKRLLRARVASPEEKAELWPTVVAAYHGYAGYQKRTRRDIPLVICEPRPPGTPGTR